MGVPHVKVCRTEATPNRRDKLCEGLREFRQMVTYSTDNMCLFFSTIVTSFFRLFLHLKEGWVVDWFIDRISVIIWRNWIYDELEMWR